MIKKLPDFVIDDDTLSKETKNILGSLINYNTEQDIFNAFLYLENKSLQMIINMISTILKLRMRDNNNDYNH